MNIFGGQGELALEMDVDGSTIKTYSWVGKDKARNGVQLGWFTVIVYGLINLIYGAQLIF